MVVAEAELAGDHLGAEPRRRAQSGACGLGLHGAGHVGQAQLLHDVLVEGGDGDAAGRDADRRTCADIRERRLELAGREGTLAVEAVAQFREHAGADDRSLLGLVPVRLGGRGMGGRGGHERDGECEQGATHTSRIGPPCGRLSIPA